MNVGLTRRARAGLLCGVFAFALGMGSSLSGCLGGNIFDYAEHALRNHILILHPPVYEWDNAARLLTGHFVLSNIYADESDREKDVTFRDLHMRVNFLKNGQHIEGWSSNYDSFNKNLVIKPGEHWVFNFTFPKPNDYADEGVKTDVREITTYIYYHYLYLNRSRISDENPRGYESITVGNWNNCLVIDAGKLRQHTDSGRCDPWEPRDSRKSLFRLSIESAAILPPAELWREWTDDKGIPLSRHPYFSDAVDFLREFDYENVTYFGGEIL